MIRPIIYKVKLVESCEKALTILRHHDRRIAEIILTKAEDLAFMPDKKGKPLIGMLAGLRSRRAVSGRYRIVYRIDSDSLTGEVVFAGLRKEGSRQDVYKEAGRVLGRRTVSK